MKESVNESTNNQLDLLLFEYLEGELSDDQKKELEKKLAVAPDLQAEMDCWKESFIEQDFYNTERLENALLDLQVQVPVKRWYSHVSLNIFLLLLVSGMFSFLPLNLNEENHTGRQSTALPTPVHAEKPQEETVNPIKPTETPKADLEKPINKPRAVSLASEAEPAISSEKEYTELYFPAISSQRAQTKISLTGSYVPAEEIKKVKVKSAAPTISRKQERRIRKMKEKALQERMAREFMKGNRAYVVPLNTTNF